MKIFHRFIRRVTGRWPGCLCREELIEFALVGLPDTERAKAEEHLRHCPRCRDQVADFAHTSAGLAMSSHQVEPDEKLKHSILKACLEARQESLDVPPVPLTFFGRIRRYLSGPRPRA
jgi:anti-sigma factor RsiW